MLCSCLLVLLYCFSTKVKAHSPFLMITILILHTIHEVFLNPQFSDLLVRHVANVSIYSCESLREREGSYTW